MSLRNQKSLLNVLNATSDMKSVTVTDMKNILLNWAGMDHEKEITELTFVLVRKYYRELNFPYSEKITEIVTRYFPLDHIIPTYKGISADQRKSDHDELMRLINKCPEIRKPYQGAFQEQVLNYLGKVSELLASLTKNIKILEIPTISCTNFLEFVRHFTGLSKADISAQVENEADLSNAMSILDACVNNNTDFFLDLINLVNLLRSHLKLNKAFSCSKTKLEKNNYKADFLNKIYEKYTNEQILEAQLSYMIKLIIGDYFITPLRKELQYAFPNKNDINYEPLFNACVKVKTRNRITQDKKLNPASEDPLELFSFEYVIPPQSKIESAINVYKNQYKTNAWYILKNDLQQSLTTNIIFTTFRKTWVNLISKNKTYKKDITFVPEIKRDTLEVKNETKFIPEIKSGIKKDDALTTERNAFIDNNYLLVNGKIFIEIKETILKSKEYQLLDGINKISAVNILANISTAENLLELLEAVQLNNLQLSANNKTKINENINTLFSQNFEKLKTEAITNLEKNINNQIDKIKSTLIEITPAHSHKLIVYKNL